MLHYNFFHHRKSNNITLNLFRFLCRILLILRQIEELKLPRQRVINIKVVDADGFINNESQKFLQARMRFWNKMYGAVASFDANTLDKNHFEIMNLFDEFMEDYKISTASKND